MLQNVSSEKRGENILVSDFRKSLQGKYQKYNFIDEDYKAKCAIT